MSAFWEDNGTGLFGVGLCADTAFVYQTGNGDRDEASFPVFGVSEHAWWHIQRNTVSHSTGGSLQRSTISVLYAVVVYSRGAGRVCDVKHVILSLLRG